MTCIALAWTSPEVVIIDLDRTKYRTFTVRDAKARRDLELFIEAQDPRAVVVLVNGVSNLARVAGVEGVKAFIVFDTITAVRSVQGAVVLDQMPGVDDHTGCVTIRMDTIHEAIEMGTGPFAVPKEALRVSEALASKITLRDLMEKVQRKGGIIVTPEFVKKTCERIVGRVQKTTWVARVRKPALAAGLDTQLLAELERFVEDGSVSEGLWRGFYDLVEKQDPMESVEQRYDVRRSDLEYLTEILGAEPVGADAYPANPTKTKKRKV